MGDILFQGPCASCICIPRETAMANSSKLTRKTKLGKLDVTA